MKNTKLTTEELDKLKSLKTTQEEITNSLGQIEIQKLILEGQKNEVINQFVTLQDEQSKVANGLQEKYGNGNIDTDTGEFTSSK